MGCVDGGVVGQRGVLSTRTVSRFVVGTPVIVPPMIGVPLVFLFLATPRGLGFIQYLVSEICFTTGYVNFEPTQTRDAIMHRVGRVTVLCPRATHVGVFPRHIVVGV